jgi:parallel beta-helix repeat protein
MKRHISEWGWIIVIAVFIFPMKTQSQEIIEVGGVLTENTLWTNEFIYLVIEDVIVSPTIKLEIAPGVEVRFNQGRGLLVPGGQLIISGTEDEKVKMIPNHSDNETWNWSGITISSINQPGKVLISHAFITKAVVGIKANAGNNLIITNNSLVENRNVGISLINSSNCLIESNNIHGNFLGLEIFSTDPSNQSSNNQVVRNHFANTTTNLIIHNSNQGGLIGNVISENLIEEGVHGIWLFKSGHQGLGNVNITRNIIINNGSASDGYGIYVSMDSTYMSDNIFWRNTTAVSFREVNHCVLANNSFYENFRAIEQRSGATKINMLRNTLTGNVAEILTLNQHEGLVFTANNLFANQQPEGIVRNNISVDISIEANFWGTTDPLVIDQIIFDKNDDPSLGELIYQPILQRADTAAPVSPPREVTAQLVNGAIKLTWRANPETDLAGYRVYWGDFGHYNFSNASEVISDTVFHLHDFSIQQPIAVTALDQSATVQPQLSGHESPFAFAVIIPYAGGDSNICKNIPVFALAQSTVPYTYNSIMWKTDGDGVFDDPGAVQPNYLIGAADLENGKVTLKLTVIADENSRSDSLMLTFADLPVAYAGEDAIIPPDFVYSNIDAFAENYDQLIWTSLGDGVFDDATLVNPVYFVGNQDITNETVQLVLEVSNIYCGSVTDTLNLIIRQQYSVSGRVWAGETLLNDSPVIAVRVNENGDQPYRLISFTDASGSFTFSDLFAGEYLFYAVNDTSSGSPFLPAYHPNQARWENAYVHQLIGDIFEIDIRLPAVAQKLPAGEGRISGNFLLPKLVSSALETYCQPWFEDAGETLCSSGLSNVTVLLFGAGGNFIYRYTLTGAGGQFSFIHLPFGSYLLEVEIAGYHSETSEIITLTAENPSVEGVLLDIEPRQKIGIYVPAQPPAGKIFNIYPNPSSSLFYVESDFFEDDEPVSLAVFDVQGQLVFQTEIRAVGKKIIVDVGKLKDGVYQCTITNEQQIRSFTFIKSN